MFVCFDYNVLLITRKYQQLMIANLIHDVFFYHRGMNYIAQTGHCTCMSLNNRFVAVLVVHGTASCKALDNSRPSDTMSCTPLMQAHLDAQFLQFSGLSFVSLGPVPRFFCVYVCVFALSCHTAYLLYYCNTVGWIWWD